MKKIVYVMNVEWNWIKQRPHFIAEGLSREYNVKIVYQYKYGRKGLQKRNKEKNLQLKPIYVIPKISGIDRLRWINDKLLNWFVKKTIHVENADYVFLTYPTQVDMIPKNFKGKIIYDCMDNHIAFFKDRKVMNYLEKKEKKLVNISDTVFVSSANLMEKLNDRYGKNESMRLIRNAYDGRILSEVDTKIYQAEDNYKIAYVGTISEWFDWNLICNTLSKETKIEFHLFGPIHKTEIPDDKGIIYHGTVEHSELYTHLKEMDCLMMPFVINDIIEAVDPVKIYEYINFSKNILVRYYDEVKRFEPFAFFYNDENEFIKCIRNLKENNNLKYTEEQRVSFLKENDWKSRIEEMQEFIK